MTVGVEFDADRIATAVQAARHIAGLDGGRYGETATYLPGRRVSGVRVRTGSATIGVTPPRSARPHIDPSWENQI